MTFTSPCELIKTAVARATSDPNIVFDVVNICSFGDGRYFPCGHDEPVRRYLSLFFHFCSPFHPLTLLKIGITVFLRIKLAPEANLRPKRDRQIKAFSTSTPIDIHPSLNNQPMICARHRSLSFHLSGTRLTDLKYSAQFFKLAMLN